MNREFIIDLLKDINYNRFPIDKTVKLLTDYCIVEHHKPVSETNKFINALLNSNFIIDGLLVEYTNIALNYYKIKFNICELYSKEGKLLQII